MISLLVLAAAASQPDLGVAQARATASVKIVVPAVGTKADWDRTPAHRKKEMTIIEADGEKRYVRLIEHE